jgi:hypothetical protein
VIPAAPGETPGQTPLEAPEEAARRAARLLRWYPRAWRERYGAEFTELLMSDIAERPRSRVRTLDVARGGIVARLAEAGLTGFAVSAKAETANASLGALGCCVAVFLVVGAALWSQLTIGWQWSAPSGTPATLATVVTSAAMLALLTLAALAVIPIIVAVAVKAARRAAGGLRAPAAVAVAAATLLFAGGRHFGNGWPGTGGHHGIVPGGLAAFEWAASLSVSAYWAHPGALAAFPAAELAWMAVSPVALTAAVMATATLVRRAELPPRLLAFETRLGTATCAVMTVFLAGCGCWVATGGQRSLFHAGVIDVAGVAVMALALGLARQASHTAGRRLRPAGR